MLYQLSGAGMQLVHMASGNLPGCNWQPMQGFSSLYTPVDPLKYANLIRRSENKTACKLACWDEVMDEWMAARRRYSAQGWSHYNSEVIETFLYVPALLAMRPYPHMQYRKTVKFGLYFKPGKPREGQGAR